MRTREEEEVARAIRCAQAFVREAERCLREGEDGAEAYLERARRNLIRCLEEAERG